MRPFSRWRMARRRMYGSATVSMRMAVMQPRLAVEAFQGVLQGQAVEDGGQHAHVVGGGLLDDLAAGAELGAAQDVAAADDDGQLHAALDDALRLPGDVSVSSMLMPLLPGWPKPSPLSLRTTRRYFGFRGSPAVSSIAGFLSGNGCTRGL